MATETYKRHQVEEAIWRYFHHGKENPAPAPKVFLVRIKRLLELDRRDDGEATSGGKLAFSEGGVRRQGVDSMFTPFNAFCLAIGLDLLNFGFKQSEVVMVMQAIRGSLEGLYYEVMKDPPVPRGFFTSEQRPGAPTFEQHGIVYADLRIFLVFERVEQEIDGESVILVPRVLRGIEELKMELHRMGYNYRRALVVEISFTASLIAKHLTAIPPRRRGRGN